jgi:MGT family glycosyltransferase
MPTALFFNVPAHGHINPSLPLVAELSARGHHIIYFASEKYRSSIEAHGATVRLYKTIYDDYFESRGLSGRVPQRVANQLIETSEEILPELLAYAQTEIADYIIFDGMCAWGSLVAKILDVPSVASLSLMPLTSPPPRALLNWQMLRLIGSMIFRDFDKGIQANKRARALTKKYGISPLRPTSILNGIGNISISYTSSYFQPYANTVDTSVRFVGRTINESSNGATESSSLALAQAGGRRLIYVSLGTLNNDNLSFFRACAEAFTNSDEYVLISTGNRFNESDFGKLPNNISIQSWVPQLNVLRQAALFITHGGLNSVHDGLYLGVPLLLVPHQEEQTLTALRVVELGAGLMLRPTEANSQSIRKLAAQLITDSKFKHAAQHIGQTLRDAGGVKYAADEIEVLLSQREQNPSH